MLMVVTVLQYLEYICTALNNETHVTLCDINMLKTINIPPHFQFDFSAIITYKNVYKVRVTSDE